MKFGFVLPRGDARDVMESAVIAEEAGWDGIFVWEPVWGVDAWICLTAAAAQTRKIQLGTLLSPVARMRPWKLASETAALDNFSGGRVILSAGLGAVDTGYESFGEAIDIRERAELMDECLAILKGLWAGQPFSFTGKHYQITPTDFVPPPSPPGGSVTTWVVGLLGSGKSMARAVQHDGILPSVRGDDGSWRALTPEDLKIIREYGSAHGNPGLDIVVEAEFQAQKGNQPSLEQWSNAGATWYVESMWQAQDAADIVDTVKTRLALGPPG